MPKLPELRTPLARAVVPVAAGIGFFVVVALVLWGIAAAISGNAGKGGLLTNDTFRPGSALAYAAKVAADGPILFPDLLGTDGDRTIVLDHTGDDPLSDWRTSTSPTRRIGPCRARSPRSAAPARSPTARAAPSRSSSWPGPRRASTPSSAPTASSRST